MTLPANATGWLELKAAETARFMVDCTRLSESPLAKKVDGGFELRLGAIGLKWG